MMARNGRNSLGHDAGNAPGGLVLGVKNVNTNDLGKIKSPHWRIEEGEMLHLLHLHAIVLQHLPSPAQVDERKIAVR
jgi:hypothetical protein